MKRFIIFLSFILVSLIGAANNEDVTSGTEQWVGRSVPWKKESGRGFAIGYGSGLWGKSFAQEIKAKIPLWQSIYGSSGVKIRGIAIHLGGSFDLGGRFEIYGASPVYLNLLRLYGGGGYQVFYPVGGVLADADKQAAHGFGGHFGFEFFLWDSISFDIEIGGQSHPRDSGATVLGGVSYYPFSNF